MSVTGAGQASCAFRRIQRRFAAEMMTAHSTTAAGRATMKPMSRLDCGLPEYRISQSPFAIGSIDRLDLAAWSERCGCLE